MNLLLKYEQYTVDLEEKYFSNNKQYNKEEDDLFPLLPQPKTAA